METGPISPLSAGLKDGDFELQTLLGRGGMGEVWRARQLSLQRCVALKFVAGMAGRVELRERLAQEARSAAQISHPNAVKIFGVTDFLGRNAVIMEEVRGRTVRERLKSGEGFSLELILSVALQTARALAAAERVGVVHRDIKPGNLMLDDEGHLTVLDFGLARMLGDPSITRTGVVLGTVHYMSPEQAAGRSTDIRSDLYSLGIVLFELLAGFPPYRSTHPAGIARAHLEEDVPRLTDSRIPEPLADLVCRLMDKDPERRIQGAAQAVRDFETVRLACLTHPQFKNPDFHSRKLELEFLETATDRLAGRSPRRPWRLVAAMGLAAVSFLLAWGLASPDRVQDPPHVTSASIPQDSKAILNRKESGTPIQSEVNLLPDDEVAQTLSSIRRHVTRGEVEEARRELGRLASLRKAPVVVAEFERSLDEIILLRRSIQGFLANGCPEEIPARLKAWSKLAPEDPLLKAYRDRLELELAQRTPAVLASREELEGAEPSSEPWSFYLRLLGAESSAGPWIPALFHRTEERLARQIALNIMEASKGGGPAPGGPLGEHLVRLRELVGLGWQWRYFRVDPVSWRREGRVFMATLDVKAEGSWPVDPTPCKLETTLHIEVSLAGTGNGSIPVSDVRWAP